MLGYMDKKIFNIICKILYFSYLWLGTGYAWAGHKILIACDFFTVSVLDLKICGTCGGVPLIGSEKYVFINIKIL